MASPAFFYLFLTMAARVAWGGLFFWSTGLTDESSISLREFLQLQTTLNEKIEVLTRSVDILTAELRGLNKETNERVVELETQVRVFKMVSGTAWALLLPLLIIKVSEWF